MLLVLLLLLQPAMVRAGTDAIDYVNSRIELQHRSYQVRIPRGYVFELLTDQLDGPRLLTFAGNGDLLVGSRSGHVYRLRPPYTHPQSLLQLTDYPHSVALRDGFIFIAQTDGLYRAPYRPEQRQITARDLLLLAKIPGGGGHNSRTVRIGPDGRIYLSLGISGNCSDQYLDDSYAFEDRRGGVMVLDESRVTARWQPFASGLRNPVGFDWHPRTGVMYASNNGPDHQGFEQPPEYFSRLDAGSFHGMPWFQFDGRRINRDTCIHSKPPRPIAEVQRPVASFPARNAPMAVTFVPAGALDPQFSFDAIVALHGSWATRPGGGFFGDDATRRPPRVVAVRFDKGRARRVDDLITGFQLKNGKRWARPVGLATGPDGALYISSDGGVNGLFRLRKLDGPMAQAQSPIK